jgi:hypothetical protein
LGPRPESPCCHPREAYRQPSKSRRIVRSVSSRSYPINGLDPRS